MAFTGRDRFDRESGRAILGPLVSGLRPHVDHWQAETLSAIAEARAGTRSHRR